MEIGRINRKNVVNQDRKIVSEKRDFSQSFNQARDRKSEEQLKKIIEDILPKHIENINEIFSVLTKEEQITLKNILKKYKNI